jgi:hypothetical protein
MFQRKELEQLGLRKEQLVSQCDSARARLCEDWHRLRSPDTWLGEMTDFTRRHPWWIVTGAMLAGTVAARTLRRPGTVVNRIARLGRFVSVALSVWKMFQKRQP